jgi:hypothetical protein
MSGYCDKCHNTLCICKDSIVFPTLQEVKTKLLIDTLIHFNGNRTKTAISMDISIRTLRNMIVVIKGDDPDLYALIPLPWNESQSKSNWRGYAQS